MKSLRVSVLLATIPGFSSLGLAHPGHDGGHDLTWDFTGAANHVLTSPYHIAVSAGVVALGSLLAWVLAKWVSASTSRTKRISKSV